MFYTFYGMGKSEMAYGLLSSLWFTLPSYLELKNTHLQDINHTYSLSMRLTSNTLTQSIL